MSDEMVSRRGLGWRVGVLGVAGPDPELLSDPVLIFVFCFFPCCYALCVFIVAVVVAARCLLVSLSLLLFFCSFVVVKSFFFFFLSFFLVDVRIFSPRESFFQGINKTSFKILKNIKLEKKKKSKGNFRT